MYQKYHVSKYSNTPKKSIGLYLEKRRDTGIPYNQSEEADNSQKKTEKRDSVLTPQKSVKIRRDTSKGWSIPKSSD